MSRNITTKPISIDCKMECHQAALPAHELARSFDLLVNKQNIPNEMLVRLNMLNPVQCIYTNGVYLYFGNFHYVSAYIQSGMKRIYVSVHQTVDDDEIKDLAFFQLLSAFITSTNENRFGACSAIVSELSKTFQKSIFADAYACTALKIIENLTGAHRNTISKQYKKLELKSQNADKDPVSILDKILNDRIT